MAGVLAALVCLSGCAATDSGDRGKGVEPVSSGIEIVGLEIQNSLHTTVYDVMVLVPATGGFVSCGQVLAGTSCSTSFPQTEYLGYPVKVSWRGSPGETVETPEQQLDLDAGLESGMRAIVKVVLLSDGLAATLLKPVAQPTTPRSR